MLLDCSIGKASDDEYIKSLDEAVRRARANKEWRREYMTLMMRDLENQEIGLEKGREEGRRSMIAAMLSKGKEPQSIADLCDIPIALVQEVQAGLVAAR